MDSNEKIIKSETDPTAQASESDHGPSTPSSPVDSNKKKKSKKIFLIIGVIVIILAVLAFVFFAALPKNNPQSKNVNMNSRQEDGLADLKKNIQSTDTAQADKHLLVYGAWTGQTSLIKAVDLTSSNNYLLATLPLAVKKVNILDDSTLLYIDGVDAQDHGSKITVYNMKNKSAINSIEASEAYLIDDYVLSPDKKYLSIWEVSMKKNATSLQGGKSRVYAVKLAEPSTKNLLYDEEITPTSPVHYPRAILNNGTVFADTFLPNDPKGGAGWAYGMSTVNFDGSGKKNIDSMSEGTYGTQPALSVDGKYLLFAGYDGSKGDGKAVNDGYRQALLTPNTVELLNTQTLERTKLPNLPNSNTYSNVSWDQISGNIIVTILSNKANDTGLFVYDLADQARIKVDLPEGEYGYITQLPGNKTLVATSDDQLSNMGNLGEHYAYALTQLAISDNKNSLSKLSVQDSYIQYITILSSNFFKNVLGEKTTLAAANPQPTIIDLYSDKNSKKENLQLYTFFLKSALKSTRISMQTNPSITVTGTPNKDDLPTCEEMAESQCAAQGLTADTEEYKSCVKTNKNNNKVSAKLAGQCSDSPLYLYGPAGKHVRVAIQTPVFNAVPSSVGEYDITLGTNGKMSIKGKEYNSIAYDYQSQLRKLPQPQRGTITNKSEVTKVLSDYAAKLGLNKKETNDLVTAGNAKVTTPYVFISFFDEETSKSILPISFYPQPDNYLNVVFYFKLLQDKPRVLPDEPLFPAPIRRDGFTAVEISEIVE